LMPFVQEGQGVYLLFSPGKKYKQKVLSLLPETQRLMASLLYGSGLRLMECHHLRIKDIDFSIKQIIVRDGKRFKDKVTVLPESVIPELKQHLDRIKSLHSDFLKRGYGEVELPFAHM